MRADFTHRSMFARHSNNNYSKLSFKKIHQKKKKKKKSHSISKKNRKWANWHMNLEWLADTQIKCF